MTAAVTCETCNDTHRMTHGDREVMCTGCPIPCQLCRQGGNGPFCETTPCACRCHRADRAQIQLAAEAADVLDPPQDETKRGLHAGYTVGLAKSYRAGGASMPYHAGTCNLIAEQFLYEHSEVESLRGEVKALYEANASLAPAAIELEKLKARRFPIMGGPSVLWSFVEPHERTAQTNHRQSLQRLAERGGLDPSELWCLVHDAAWDARVDPTAARAWLAEVVRLETASAREEELRKLLNRALSRWGDAIRCIEIMSKELSEHEDCEDDINMDREFITKARELVPETKP